MTRWLLRCCSRPFPLWIGALALLTQAKCQNLIPNGKFDRGDRAPAGWTHSAQGEESATFSTDRFLRVRGDGQDSSSWSPQGVKLAAGSLFRLQFRGRREPGAVDGTAISGPERVNRDFPLDASWRSHRFVFMTPTEGEAGPLRLGQWHVKGALNFDDVELVPVSAAHRRVGAGMQLGEAESIRQGVYRFEPSFGWQGANYHRPLRENRAAFNSQRWVFGAGAQISYAHAVAGFPFMSGKVRLSLNYYDAGSLVVQASRDGQSWVKVEEWGKDRRQGWCVLPASLFPSPTVHVRLAFQGTEGGLQVDQYEFQGDLQGKAPDLEGSTSFLEQLECAPGVSIALQNIELSDPRGRYRCDLQASFPPGPSFLLHPMVEIEVDGQDSDNTRAFTLPDRSVAGTTNLTLICPGSPSVSHRLRIRLLGPSGNLLYDGAVGVEVGLLDDRRYGNLVLSGEDLAIWWCESAWKVGRDRAIPKPPLNNRVKPVAVSAARGEYESVQLVLRPSGDCRLVAIHPSSFTSGTGTTAALQVQVDEVAYVQVTRPTDSTCRPGWYPDPLPPLRQPVQLLGGQNQPFWITVFVPPGTPGGTYLGDLDVETSFGSLKVPMQVRVYDFDLPKETHLRSAFGLGTDPIQRYHALTNQEQRRLVFNKYLTNFAQHRISPYSFFDYDPIQVSFVGAGSNRVAKVDFTGFDAAARQWLDENRFSSFQLPLQGMGGGTFDSRHLGELLGFKEGTPEHARLFGDYLGQVQQHLRERGWLSKAFTYWFDEPEPKDYDFVIDGMQRIKAAAPGLRRMLTEQPDPKLSGHVEIWCGLTPEWNPSLVQERRKRGEEVWWYICTAPKAPYITEFIDHPGLELRLWPWQSWQYGVQGILVWASLYWTSPQAYPAPTLQDPWIDPMSWVSGYGGASGDRQPWGNGDGRFLYPPRRDPNRQNPASLDDPVNSIRWENLRDGMEDYEYLWLLETTLRRVEEKVGTSEMTRQARALLTVPAEVSVDLTHFATDPAPLYAHREKLARYIERLQKRSGTPEQR